MKHKIIKKVLAVITAAVILMVLTSGSGIKGEMAGLIKARTDILNGYFCGHINYYDALRQIKEIETGSLMEEDIQAMRDNFQTDIEEVDEYKISEIELTFADEDLVCGVVTIDWHLSGTGGNETMQEIYSVIMEKHEKKYKLVQFF